jgi:hypothetical protein
MQVQELINAEFTLTDSLAPSLLRELGVVAQALDAALPRPHPGVSAEQLAARQAARREKLAEAERTALDLVVPSAFDLQVIVVALRATLEVRGIAEGLLVVRALTKVLGEPWASFVSEAQALKEPESKKVERKRGRFIDAVLEQMFDALASWEAANGSEPLAERIGGPPALGPEWTTELMLLEAALEARNLRPARWDALVERVRSLSVPATGTAIDAGVAPASEPETPVAQPTADDGPGEPPGGGSEPVVQGPGGSAATNRGSRVALRVSARFWDLIDRLEAFRWCVQHDEFEKAAIVAEDVEARLTAFDAPGLFPELFADFFEGLSVYSGQIEEHMGGGRSLRSQALNRLYQSDVALFLNEESVATGSTRSEAGVRHG